MLFIMSKYSTFLKWYSRVGIVLGPVLFLSGGLVGIDTGKPDMVAQYSGIIITISAPIAYFLEKYLHSNK